MILHSTLASLVHQRTRSELIPNRWEATPFQHICILNHLETNDVCKRNIILPKHRTHINKTKDKHKVTTVITKINIIKQR